MQENKARGKFASVRALLDRADDLLAELEPPMTLHEKITEVLWEFRRKPDAAVISRADASIAADLIMKHILDKLHQ
jgi:hypothetical protein